MNIQRGLAFVMLGLHLVWLGWVLLGWLFTQGRPPLRWLHIGSLLYGIFITLGPWPCPLTLAEQHFQRRAGLTPYETSFLEHYVDALVYPDVPLVWLTWGGVIACSLILGVHVWRFHTRTAQRW